MRDLLIGAIVFGLLPFVLKRPFLGILLSAWLGYMNPHLLCYGFMRTMPVVMLVALATMVGMLYSKETKRIVWSREIVVLVMFIGWMGITTTQAFFFDLALDQYTKVVKIQILTFMALMLLTSRERVNMFLWIIVLSLGFYGIKGGIFTIINGGAYRVQGPGNSFIAGNNELALALVMTIPLMRYLQLQSQHHIVKLGFTAAMFLTALAAIGSQSRGALIAICLTAAMFWLKSRKKFGAGVLIVIAAVTITNLMPAEWYARMNTINTYEQDESALGRINAWWTAWNLANDRLFGGGFETWRPYVFSLYAPDPANVRAPHSVFFQVLGEQGWVGFTLFMTMIAFTWATCGRIRLQCKQQPELEWARDLAAMIQVSMVGYLSAGAFLGLANFDYIYHLVTLVAVTQYLIKEPQVAQVPARAGTERSKSLLAGLMATLRRI